MNRLWKVTAAPQAEPDSYEGAPVSSRASVVSLRQHVWHVVAASPIEATRAVNAVCTSGLEVVSVELVPGASALVAAEVIPAQAGPGS